MSGRKSPPDMVPDHLESMRFSGHFRHLPAFLLPVATDVPVHKAVISD